MTARLGASILLLLASLAPSPASACGGFFCGFQPADQQAERVVFAVDEAAGTTEMIVQIQYTGAAEEFAWVVPLAAVPEEGSLATFPAAALQVLDRNTAPVFSPSDPCASASAIMPGVDSVTPRELGSTVTVHEREEVGPYDVAVVESTDVGALVAWLRDHGYRVTTAMEPLIAEYAAAGRVFLALRLRGGVASAEIEPFRMTLPGTSPSIPLRMTAVAAEPEMAIVVTILGSQRYESATWPDLEIAPEDLAVWVESTPESLDLRFNWPEAVARAVDAAGGRGWVTEMAGGTRDLRATLDAMAPATPEQEEARAALGDLLGDHAYLTRLYTRLSPEEMTSDPVFRRSAGGDVDRNREFAFLRADRCELPDDPCPFMACGAGGRCAELEDGTAGCACVPGATARTTRTPFGEPTVTCVDRRVSFVEPGDRATPDGPRLGDPCVGFDCGAGECVTVNLVPTCACDRGAVAIGDYDDAGGRVTTCVTPLEPVPEAFYDERLPELPVSLDSTAPRVRVGGGGGCAVAPRSSPPTPLLLLALAGLARRRRR